MKKVLFGTTALVGAALIASAASAESPKVTVGGFLDFQAGFLNDDLDTAQRGYGFRNDTEVSFKIDGVADSGLKYGGEVSLEADVTADADTQGVNASRTYLYLEGSNWGRLEFGSNVGADQTLKIDASSIARATGGIDGAWTYFAHLPTGLTGSGSFIATPDLPMNYGQTGIGDETTENAAKVTYYTPRWSGFQAGLSFTPDMTDRGQIVTMTDTLAGAGTYTGYGDIWQGGLSYDTTMNGWGIGLAATGEAGNADSAASAPFKDLRAYTVGGKLAYLGFSLAGSYGNWNKSMFTIASDTKSDFWTLGGAYEFGPFGASVTYLNSTVNPTGGSNARDFHNVSVGADWKLAPGFTPYVEATFFDFNSEAGTTTAFDNNGSVFIVGSQLAF